MWRNGLLVWLCAGALGAGTLAALASRRSARFKKVWFFLAFILGPLFFFFVLPAWLDNWRKTKESDS